MAPKERKVQAEDENSVRLSSYEETGKSNPNGHDLDEGQSSSVQLQSLEDEDENESVTISASNEKNQKNIKDRKVTQSSEKISSSSPERKVSSRQKSSEKNMTDSLADSNLIETENEEIKNNNSNPKYNSGQKSDASMHSSSKPAKQTSENDQDASVEELGQKINLLIQANQKLVAAVLENQKAISNSIQDSNAEEALKHIQAAFELLSKK